MADEQNYKEQDKLTINDFGFSMTTEENIKKTDQDKAAQAAEEHSKTQLKLKRVRDKVWPLLEGLKKDAHKDVIHWPNRLEVINRLMKEIQDIIDA